MDRPLTRGVRVRPTSAIAGATMLAVLPLLSGCGNDAKQAVEGAPVEVQPARLTAEVSSVTLTGELKARVQSDLAFRIAGRITTRNVDVGDQVEAGQVLATLEIDEQSADLKSAQAGVQAAQATLKQASATFGRQQTLLAQGFTTKADFDEAKQNLQSAQASLDGANAALGTAQDQLDNAALRADAPGVVTAREAEAGQVVEAAQTIFTVAQNGARDAVFEVQEALVARRPADTSVEIALVSDPSVKAVGTVREVAPAIDPATGTVRVKVGLDDAPPQMSLGAAVSGVGRFQPREVFVVPWTAFFIDGGKPAVWVVDKAARSASLRPVVVDSYRTGDLLLSKGLSEGDLVVTAGAQLLRPGEIVTPQTVAPPTNAGTAP